MGERIPNDNEKSLLGQRRCWWVMIVTISMMVGACASTPSEKDSTSKEVSSTGKKDQSDDAGSKSKKVKKASASSSGDQASMDGAKSKQKKPVSTGDQPAPKQRTGSDFPKIQRAVNVAQRGNQKRATKILNRLVDEKEQGHLAAYNLGVIHEKNGDMGGAAKKYNQSLRKDPDFTPALINLVRLYVRQGRLDDADRIARKYIDKRPENLDHRAAQLEVLLAKERHSEVIRKAKSLLRRDERNVEAMVAMAKANFWMERYELSKAILQRATDLAPERADVYFLFGLIAMENEENGRAISNFKKAITLNGRFAEAHNNLGLLYYDAGDYKGASKQFQEALADYPDFNEAMLNLGNSYKGLGKLKKAEEQFKTVMERDSENADAYFNLGVLYLDGDLPGMKKIPRLQKSIDMLNEYKRLARGQLGKDDPADDYIKSARKKIKAEKQRQEMMRQTQQSAGGGQGGGNESGK